MISYNIIGLIPNIYNTKNNDNIAVRHVPAWLVRCVCSSIIVQ